MYTFSDKSEAALATMHPDLQRVFRTAIQIKDFAVIEGHRGEGAQHAAFVSGASKVDWPLGKHNKIPSDAGDVRPFDPVTHKLGVVADGMEKSFSRALFWHARNSWIFRSAGAMTGFEHMKTD